MELDSDRLYILATGFSILSILAVVFFKYCFGADRKREDKEERNEAKQQPVKGRFGQLPISEWKQHKLALEQEYKERCMDSSNSAESTDAATDSAVDSADAKTSTGKVVRFQNVEDKPQKTEDCVSTNDGTLEDMLDGEKLDEETLEHLPAHLKSAKLRSATKELEEGLTDEQKEEETRVRNEQLESIFNLMREQQEKFGVASMEDIEEQLKLYSF